MKLQQLRCLTEVARRGLNVSEAAEALHTSQPGVSKQIKALEDELGIQVFVRHGKRLVAVTEPGKAVVAIAERILSEAQNLRRAGEEFANDKLGTLTIAATHTQARYALPNAVTAFKRRYPNVKLVIHQGNPTQICEQVLAGEADFCVATEMIELYSDIVSMPVYQWNRCVVVPPKHPLLKAGPLTLEKLAQYPIVTYDFAFANRSLVQKAFEAKGLNPNVVLTALDADVIKTYVELGLGIGILAKMAFNPARDRTLRAIDASHLFESSTTRLGIKRGAYLRRYAYEFIELFAPHLPRNIVEPAVMGEEGSRYEKPKWNLEGVELEVALDKPFCKLVHFKQQTPKKHRVLVVAPLSGHHATLVRDTVRSLLAEHDVWVTDWVDARMVPLNAGPFHLADYVDYVREWIRMLSPQLPVLSVCQPTGPGFAGGSR